MLELLVYLVAIATVFAVAVVFGGRFIVGRMNAVLDRRLQDTDWIMSSGIAPPRWFAPFQRRLRMLQRLTSNARLRELTSQHYKRKLERRLFRFLRHIEATNVIGDAEVRATMASTIRHIGRSWENSTLAEVVGLDPEDLTDPNALR